MATQTREQELRACNARELMRMATTMGIKGSWDMKKAEVIDAILRAEDAKDGGATASEQSAKVNDETDNHGTSDDHAGDHANGETAIDMAKKMPYIEDADIGTLVAFKLPNGKVKSAKIIKKSSKSRRLMLETAYGAQHIVSYDDIIWVRTGKRWPSGVYRQLKGMVESDGTGV